MVTLKEVAQRCGVSVATVSNILNGKHKVSQATKQRVLEVVKETGYQPNYFAQGMRKQKTNMIGIITEDLNEFSSTPIVEAIMAYCEDHGYRTILINMRMYDKWENTWYNDDEKLQSVLQSAITEMLSIKVDGIVYVAGHCRVINCFHDDFSIPAIVVYALSKSQKFTSVIIDDEKGGYDMTKYLISMGHRKIGVIGGVADNIHTKNRLIGFQKALYENQIPFNPTWLCFGDWRRQSAKEGMKKLIDAGVTAVFCMNDLMAGGAYDCIIEQELQVGVDISVVGYDNRMISEYLRPKLTTNEIPFQEIGKKAVDIMLNMLENGSENEDISKIIKIPCKMEIRDSVTQR